MLAVGGIWMFASILLLLHSCGLTAAQQPRLQQAANGMCIVLAFLINKTHQGILFLMFTIFLYFSINITVSTVFVRTEDASVTFLPLVCSIPVLVKKIRIFSFMRNF